MSGTTCEVSSLVMYELRGELKQEDSIVRACPRLIADYIDYSMEESA